MFLELIMLKTPLFRLAAKELPKKVLAEIVVVVF